MTLIIILKYECGIYLWGKYYPGTCLVLSKNSENVIQFLHPSLSHWSIHNHLFSFFFVCFKQNWKTLLNGRQKSSCLLSHCCFLLCMALRKLKLSHNKKGEVEVGGRVGIYMRINICKGNRAVLLVPPSNKISQFTSSSRANTVSLKCGFYISLNSLLDLHIYEIKFLSIIYFMGI